MDESEGAESSTEHVDPDGKPLVDISLARGIHVIDPNKGEEVHVGWSGIHVANERKGEEVHVGPGGLHIDTLEDDGHSVHTNDDGTVTIDGETFSSWKEAHDKLDHHGKHFHTKIGRAWNEFPFPALVVLAYLALGIICGTWGMGLFLVFLIPVYYAMGDFIDRRHLSKLIGSVYPTAAIDWFLGQFQHGNWHLTHCMPRKRPIYYDELDEADHTYLFRKSASHLPAVLLSPFSAWSKAFESS